jgi:hypothetical protein
VEYMRQLHLRSRGSTSRPTWTATAASSAVASGGLHRGNCDRNINSGTDMLTAELKLRVVV